MWKLLKFTLLTLLLVVLGLAVYLGSIFLTPVTADNGESRIADLCSVATMLASAKIARLDRDVPPLRPGLCGCAAREAVKAYGEREAARIAEVIRANLLKALKNQQPDLSREDERAVGGLVRLTGAHLRKCAGA